MICKRAPPPALNNHHQPISIDWPTVHFTVRFGIVSRVCRFNALISPAATTGTASRSTTTTTCSSTIYANRQSKQPNELPMTVFEKKNIFYAYFLRRKYDKCMCTATTGIHFSHAWKPFQKLWNCEIMCVRVEWSLRCHTSLLSKRLVHLK